MLTREKIKCDLVSMDWSALYVFLVQIRRCAKKSEMSPTLLSCLTKDYKTKYNVDQNDNNTYTGTYDCIQSKWKSNSIQVSPLSPRLI
jgi:hypothetical protein